MGKNTFFCTLLREIRVTQPLLKVRISISDAYFSAMGTKPDFFNTIGQKQTFDLSKKLRSYK